MQDDNAKTAAIAAALDEETDPPGGATASASGTLQETDENRSRLVSEQDVYDAINRFMESPKWARIFDEAPDNAKTRLAITFYYSDCKDNPGFPVDAYRDLRMAVEKTLSDADLEYLANADIGEAATKRYRDMLEKRRGKGAAG